MNNVNGGRAYPRLDIKFAAEIIVSVKLRMSLEALHRGVRVRAGLSPMADVTHEALRKAVGRISELEGIKRIELVIEPLVVEIRCLSCGGCSKHTSKVICCPACNHDSFEVIHDPVFRIHAVESCDV